MKITTDKLYHIANDYIVQIIIPKMPNNYLKFGLAFASNYIGSNFINNQLEKYKGLIEKFGIIDDNNCIDIDLFKDNALKALKVCDGNKFEIYGYNVDEEDINSLYSIAKNYANPTYSPLVQTNTYQSNSQQIA